MRSRQLAEARRDRFRGTRAKWAAALPPEPRAEFERLLDEADELVDRGWNLRWSAFALARRHIEGAPEVKP